MVDYQAVTAVLSALLTLGAGYLTASQNSQRGAITRAHERLDAIAGKIEPAIAAAPELGVLEQELLAQLRGRITPTLWADAERAAYQVAGVTPAASPPPTGVTQ